MNSARGDEFRLSIEKSRKSLDNPFMECATDRKSSASGLNFFSDKITNRLPLSARRSESIDFMSTGLSSSVTWKKKNDEVGTKEEPTGKLFRANYYSRKVDLFS